MGRARSSMSIAPPASDSVTNRRELEFSNQILKTKQDGTDRRAERPSPASSHLQRSARGPTRPSSIPQGSTPMAKRRAPPDTAAVLMAVSFQPYRPKGV